MPATLHEITLKHRQNTPARKTEAQTEIIVQNLQGTGEKAEQRAQWRREKKVFARSRGREIGRIRLPKPIAAIQSRYCLAESRSHYPQ